MQNQSCVFILGNGFSQGFGFPSFRQLWKDCLAASTKIQVAGYFRRCLDQYPLSYFRSHNIEDIELLLSIWSSYIENYKEVKPDCSQQETSEGYYNAYIENLCGHLLEYGDRTSKDTAYNSFKTWLKNKALDWEFSFVTFNYDLILERLITEIGRKIVYFGDSKTQNSVFIRKLHGSANWLKANSGDLQRADGLKPPIIWKDKDVYVYNINYDFSNMPYIAFASPPVLIPPVINKKYTDLFYNLWTSTSKDLQKAKFIIIVGYSLPESDIFVRRFLENHSKHATAQCLRFAYINSSQEHCEEAKKLLDKKVEIVNKLWNIKIFDEILQNKKK